MKIYVVTRKKDADNFMPWKETEVPVNKLSDLGAIHIHDEKFFESEIANVSEEDTVIIYIGLTKEEHKKKLKDLKCTKVLRSMDAKNTDGIVHRRNLEFHEEVGRFDYWLIGIPNEKYNSVLSERGINGINFTHCTNFDDIDEPENVFAQKQADVIVSGQMHETCYPVRWKVYQALTQTNEIRGMLLPHPGYERDALRHPYVGDAYVEFCKNFWSGAVGTGHADGLHMKFLEFAKSYTLPLGNTPTYMDEACAKEVLAVGLGEPFDETNKILKDILSNKAALKERIIRYSQAVRNAYDVNVVVPDVYDKILNKKFDF